MWISMCVKTLWRFICSESLLFAPFRSTLKSARLIKTITSQETRRGALLKLKYINRPNDFQMRICALILHHLKSDSPDLHAAVYIPQCNVLCDLLHIVSYSFLSCVIATGKIMLQLPFYFKFSHHNSSPSSFYGQ